MKGIHKWLLGVGGTGAFILLLGSATRSGKARIVAPGVNYVPSQQEWLWLARAIYCESSSSRGRLAAAWAMIQRFVAFRQQGNREYGASLTATVRAFSQPVNPIWSSNRACRNGRGCCGNCSDEDIDRRLRCQRRSWDDLPPDVVRTVRAFSSGHPKRNPVPGLCDFAACWYVEEQGLESRARVGGNCFVVGPGIRGTVRVIPL